MGSGPVALSVARRRGASERGCQGGLPGDQLARALSLASTPLVEDQPHQPHVVWVGPRCEWAQEASLYYGEAVLGHR